MRSHKVAIIGIFLLFIVGAGAFALYWYKLRSPVIDLIVSPSNASVEIDGNRVLSFPIKSQTGQHKIKISETGYVTYVRSIMLKRTEQYNLNVLLKPTPYPMLVSGISEASAPVFIKNNLVLRGNNGSTLYTVSTSGDQSSFNASALTSNVLSGVGKVAWRPDGKAALLEKANGVYLYDFSRTDLLNQTITLWGTNIGDVVWSPDSFQAVYTYYTPDGQGSLITADIQNKNTKIIANLAQAHIYHPVLSWSPDGQYISMIDQSPQKDTNYLYSISIFDDKITQLTQAGEVSGSVWSPNSQWIAYTAYNPNSAQNLLWLVNNQNQTIQPLNISVSSIKDVAWSPDSKSLVVAQKNNQKYALVSLDLNGKSTDYQYNSAAGFAPNEIVVSPDGKYLFYIQNGSLESLSLITNNY